MIKITDVSREKFRRVKLNMQAIKKAATNPLQNGKYTPMIVDTMAMIEGSKNE